MSPKMQVLETASSLPKPHNEGITEITVEAFSQVMKSVFLVLNERVPGRPYAVRYTGQPYDHSNEETKSIQVSSHAKGAMLSPLVIFAVLEKFDIPEAAFAAAIASATQAVEEFPEPVVGVNKS